MAHHRTPIYPPTESSRYSVETHYRSSTAKIAISLPFSVISCSAFKIRRVVCSCWPSAGASRRRVVRDDREIILNRASSLNCHRANSVGHPHLRGQLLWFFKGLAAYSHKQARRL